MRRKDGSFELCLCTVCGKNETPKQIVHLYKPFKPFYDLVCDMCIKWAKKELNEKL